MSIRSKQTGLEKYLLRSISLSMLAIIHHPDYDAASVGSDHRFPMRKYSLVAEILHGKGYCFQTPEHASQAALELAHDAAYVRAVLTSSLDPKAARRVGFEMTPAIAARSRASVGGTILASRMALSSGQAVNLAGGSHHADRQGGAGFCVFNDVAVAARVMLEEAQVRRIAVIDLDVHHGDGTARIFGDDSSVFTASLHCEDNWPREKPPSDLDIGLPKGTEDDAYLDAVSKITELTIDQARPDLIYYNAGVDPHIDDRLGLFHVSDEGLRERERIVAETAKEHGIPLVGVLGGGYSKDAHAVATRHTYLVEAFNAILKTDVLVS